MSDFVGPPDPNTFSFQSLMDGISSGAQSFAYAINTTRGAVNTVRDAVSGTSETPAARGTSAQPPAQNNTLMWVALAGVGFWLVKRRA
jgi:hypothetical protein